MSQIVIRILTKDFTRAGFDKAGKNVKRLDQELKKAGRQMKLLGLAAAGVAGVAVKKFADFDTGIAEITTLLGDVSEQGFKVMGEEIKSASIEFGQAIDKMTKARYDIISAGFTEAAQSSTLLAASAKLAVAGVSSVDRTADVLTTTLNAYGQSADKASRFSDILFETVRLGKTTIDQLAGSFGTAAAIAPTLGVSIEEIGAGIATLTSQGQATDQAVTALQATFVSFLRPTEALKDRLTEMGFESGKAAIAALGLQGALDKIVEGATEADKSALFANIRAMKGVFPIVGTASDKFTESLKALNKEGNQTETAFRKVNERLGQQLKVAMAQINVGLINLGENLAPVASGVAQFIGWLSELSPQSTTAVAAMTAMTTAVFILKGAIISLFGPIGIAVSLIGTLAVGAFLSMESPAERATNSVNNFTKSLVNMNKEQKQNELVRLKNEITAAEKAWDNLKKAQEIAKNSSASAMGTQTLQAEQIKQKIENQKIAVEGLREQYDILAGSIEAAKNAEDERAAKALADAQAELDALKTAADGTDNGGTDNSAEQQKFDARKELILSETELERIAFEERSNFAIEHDTTLDQIDADRVARHQVTLDEIIEQEKRSLTQKNILWKTGERAYDAFMGSILNTDMSGSEKRAQIWKATQGIFISLLADMLKEQIATWIASAAAGKVQETAAIASAAVTGTAIAAAYAPAATFASIASFGGAAVAGEAAIVAAQATSAGFTLFAQDGAIVPTGTQVGTDRVPALLTPGEAVISRPVVQDNPALINSLVNNSGGGGNAGGNNITIAPVFNISTIDSAGVDDFIRGDDFRESLINSINDRLIDLNIDGQSVAGEA